MKIVFSTLFRQSMGGGVGIVAYEITPAFAKKHQVLFIQPGKSSGLRKKSESLTLLRVKAAGKGEVSIPILDLGNIEFIFKSLKKFSPDIIHAQDPGPISFLLQLWAKENGVPFVYTSHILPTKTASFGAKEFVGQLGKVFDSGVVKKYFVNFFEDCDGVIALNESAKRDIKKFGYSGRIFMIPNGRNLSTYNALSLPSVLTLEKELIFIGYLSSRKNQKYLLEMMRYLPKSYFLTLVGYALNKDYLDSLKADINKYNLENVRLAGKVDHKKIPSLLQRSHLFVSASKMEVQSLVILEALAAGKPVVGLLNETIGEFVDEAAGFKLPKKASPKEFARAVEKICQMSQEEYERLCANARKKVAHLDWENVVEQTTAAYRQVIGSLKKKALPSKFGVRDAIERLAEVWNIKVNLSRKQLEVRNNLYLFSLILLTSIGGSFYSLIETTQNLKAGPFKYLSKTTKKLLAGKI